MTCYRTNVLTEGDIAYREAVAVCASPCVPPVSIPFSTRHHGFHEPKFIGRGYDAATGRMWLNGIPPEVVV